MSLYPVFGESTLRQLNQQSRADTISSILRNVQERAEVKLIDACNLGLSQPDLSMEFLPGARREQQSLLDAVFRNDFTRKNYTP